MPGFRFSFFFFSRVKFYDACIFDIRESFAMQIILRIDVTKREDGSDDQLPIRD